MSNNINENSGSISDSAFLREMKSLILPQIRKLDKKIEEETKLENECSTKALNHRQNRLRLKEERKKLENRIQ